MTLAVVADGATLKAAKEAAAQRGVLDPVMHAVPESDGHFLGAGAITLVDARFTDAAFASCNRPCRSYMQSRFTSEGSTAMESQ